MSRDIENLSSQNPPTQLSPWGWITTPHASLKGISQRRQAVISAVMAMGLFIFGFVGAVVSLRNNETKNLWVYALTIVVSLLAYLIIKSGYATNWGKLLLMVGFFSTVFGNILNGTLDAHDGLIIFIPLLLTLSVIVVNTWGLALLTLANLAVMFLLPSLGVSLPDGGAALFLLVIAFGIVLVFISNFWMGIEKNQKIELQDLEQEALAIRLNLQKRVEERTTALDRRASRLEAAALVTRSAAEIRDLKVLLETIARQISDRFGFYHIGIFLADDNFTFLKLVAASSNGGKSMLDRGHKLGIGREGIVGYAAHQKRPRIAQHVSMDAVFFNNPDLPSTRSEAALPLIAQDRVIGVLDIQSEEVNAFKSEDISVLQTMTDQLALAIDNILLVEQSRMAIKTLEALNSSSILNAWKARFGDQVRGYSYSPMGITPINELMPKSEAGTDDSQVLEVPLMLQGMKIGSISLVRKSRELSWSDTEKELAQGVATQVALAINNARLLEDSQTRAIREQTMSELSNRFSRSLDIDTLLRNAVQEIYRLPQVSQVSLFVSPIEQTKQSE